MTQGDCNFERRAELWYEISEDGRVWRHASLYGRERAVEGLRDLGEAPKLLSAYSAVLEASAARLPEPPRFIRTVMQGERTRRVAGVMPRRWDSTTGRYEPTGGEWCVTDTPDAALAHEVEFNMFKTGDLLVSHPL